MVAFLKQKSARTLLDLEAAVPLLYKILVNHAAYPFAPDLSASLDFDAMLRAFALLSAKGTESIGGGQGMGGQVLIRKKSDSDNRKMLFRSLAIPIDGTVADTNLDAPDPTADTLEALTCWQFSNRGASASTAPMSRQQLQPRARGLVERRPDIDSMCIPRQGMCELLKFLFTCRFNGSSSNREYLSAPSSEIDQAV